MNQKEITKEQKQAKSKVLILKSTHQDRSIIYFKKGKVKENYYEACSVRERVRLSHPALKI
jgi:hypothetical protein